MNLFYCEKCHTLIREADIASGAAKLSGEDKYICATCSGKASAPIPIPAFAANSTAHIKIPKETRDAHERRESGARPHAHSSSKRPPAPDKKSGRDHVEPKSTPLIPILGGAGAAILILVIVLLMRGKPTPPKVDTVKNDTPPPKQTDPLPTPTPPTPLPTNDPPINTDKPVPPPLDLPGKGPEAEDSPRERMARRDLEGIKNWWKEHPSDAFGYAERLADFVARNRNSAAGREAVKILAEHKLPSRADQPLKHYPLDENDAAGTAFKGKAYITGGKVGRGAVVLGGNAEDFVDLGDDPALNFGANAPFTIAGWFRTSADYAMLVSFRNSKDHSSVLDIAIGSQGASNAAGKLMALARQDGSSDRFGNLVGGKANDGAWHHFAFTRTNTGLLRLYMDGVMQTSQTAPEGKGAITTDWRALGIEQHWLRYPTASKPQDGQGLKGEMDDVRIYGVALTELEIKELTEKK